MAPFDDAKILFVVLHIANLSWPLVLADIEWFQANDLKKKLWLDEVKFQPANGLLKISSNAAWIQNGWPSATSSGVQPNSPSAVANIQNEHVSTQIYFIVYSTLTLTCRIISLSSTKNARILRISQLDGLLIPTTTKEWRDTAYTISIMSSSFLFIPELHARDRSHGKV